VPGFPVPGLKAGVIYFDYKAVNPKDMKYYRLAVMIAFILHHDMIDLVNPGRLFLPR